MANWKLHRYYRGVVVPRIKDRLNELQACPFLVLDTHLTHQVLKSITKIESHSKLDNKQFLLFLEEIFCIAAHLDLVIPDPNESEYEQEDQTAC